MTDVRRRTGAQIAYKFAVKHGDTRKMNRTAARNDSFDRLVLTELEIVRTSEERLERLFPKLRTNPQLQESFLQELAAVRERADRLDAILSGLEAVQTMPAARYTLPAA
jgi:hypothetical protein